MPFDNRSNLEEDEFFVEGIHGDLLTNLARIGSLKVISRTSVAQYKDTEKTVPQIASELGVSTVMEGAVQRSGDIVRVNQFPTDSLEAYNAYLRGRQLLPLRTAKDLTKAMELFEQAVEIDPDFALAWTSLGSSALLLPDYSDFSLERAVEIVQEAVKRALELNPQLGEAHTLNGGILEDRQAAEAAFKRGIELSPNSAMAYKYYSNFIKYEFDRLEFALELLLKAEQLDPLSPIVKSNIASAYRRLGRFDEAEAKYLQTIVAYPDFSQVRISLGWGLYKGEMGRLDGAIMQLRKGQQANPGGVWGPLLELSA